MNLESVRAFLADKAPDIVIKELGGHEMKDFNKWSFADDAPPATLPSPLQALWWLKKGGLALGPEWNKAHELCQKREGEHAYDLVHALVHWIEGDKTNTAYWYRRVGGQRAADINTEWQRIASELSK